MFGPSQLGRQGNRMWAGFEGRGKFRNGPTKQPGRIGNLGVAASGSSGPDASTKMRIGRLDASRSPESNSWVCCPRLVCVCVC